MMLQLRQTWMSAVMACAIGGCAARNVDMLETRLREQEDSLAEMQRELTGTKSELEIARRESEELRKRLGSPEGETLVSEQARVLYRVQGVKFNTMLTGGLNLDDTPGDDGLSAMLMPVDSDGDLIKLPGAIHFELLDLSQPEEQQRLGQWNYTVDEARPHWHRGLMSAGYLFRLPWQRVPQSATLTLHGRLIVPDGRKFDTTQQVIVQLSDIERVPKPPKRDPKPSAKTPPTIEARDRSTPPHETKRPVPETKPRANETRQPARKPKPPARESKPPEHETKKQAHEAKKPVQDEWDKVPDGSLPPTPRKDKDGLTPLLNLDPAEELGADERAAAGKDRPVLQTVDSFTTDSIPRLR